MRYEMDVTESAEQMAKRLKRNQYMTVWRCKKEFKKNNPDAKITSTEIRTNEKGDVIFIKISTTIKLQL